MREVWASKLGMLFATIGFSIGIGNIWRFPFLVGSHGGGAFLVVYLLIVLLIGIPLFTLELGMGRATSRSPVGAYRRLAPGSPWYLMGFLACPITIGLLAAYTAPVMGWFLAYVFKSAQGSFLGLNQEQIAGFFGAFISNPWEAVFWTFLTVGYVVWVVSKGLNSGVERWSKILMPVLFGLLLVLVVRSMTLPGATKGLIFYLKPDLSKLTMTTVLAALGQVFYSIGIGMGAGMVFGGYMNKATSVPGTALTVALADTTVAFVAGLMIFPAVFAFGLEPASGPTLTFITMPNVFNHMPLSTLFGSLFYLLVFIAGVTSSIGAVESLVAWLSDEYGIARRKAALGAGLVVFGIAVPSALSFGPLAQTTFAGKTFFDLADFLVSNIFLPVGAIGMALFVGWIWGMEHFRKESDEGALGFRVTTLWDPIVKYIIPLAVLLIFLAGLGIIG